MNYIEAFRASVRPGLAWLFGTTACAGFLMGKIEVKEFLVFVGVVITFYFTSREKDKSNG